jgi:pimeloyl-ACP methyl ester carboxylesterase
VVFMARCDAPSAFTNDAARARFVARYDRVLEELWPVPVNASDLEVSAGQVRVYRAGPSAAGPSAGDPIVLVAGAGGNALAWHRYIEPLARSRPVVAVDPLGEAGRSIQRRPIITGAEVGSWLTEVLEALDVERAHLVGSSFGGTTVLEQQLGGGGRASAVTLLDPAGLAPITARFYRWIIAGGLAALLPRRWRHGLARRLHNGTLHEDALMTLVRAGTTFRRRLPNPDLYTDEQLRAVDVPVQVLLGAQSALHPADAVAARLAAAVPSWHVEIVPDTGHALPVEAPDVVVPRVLGFPGPALRHPDPYPTTGRP